MALLAEDLVCDEKVDAEQSWFGDCVLCTAAISGRSQSVEWKFHVLDVGADFCGGNDAL